MINNNERLTCVDTYTVQAGDTLYSISQAYNVPVRLLMAVNKITNPYNLRIGRRLCIPGYNCRPYCSPSGCVPPIINRPPGGQGNQGGGGSGGNQPDSGEQFCRGTYYTVVEGDSFYMIAKKHRLNLNALLEANPEIDPYNLIIGTQLCIPSR